MRPSNAPPQAPRSSPRAERQYRWPDPALAADQDNLASTYAGWRATAERTCAEMDVSTHRLQRIDVDVEMLWTWCCAQGRPLDGPARAECVTRLVRQMADGSADA